jgi:hypothetical protein
MMAPMDTQRRAPTVLILALDLGLLGDQLIRAPVWGLNVSLGLAAACATAATVWLGRDPHDTRSAWPWLAAAFFAAMWTVRDAETLLGADLMAALALASLPLVPEAARVAARAGDTLVAPLHAAQHAIAGVFRLGPHLRPALQRAATATRAGSVGVGVLLAIPVVLVFAALFASADPLFDAAVSSAMRMDLGPVVSHGAVAGALAWVIAGYLWAVATPPRVGLTLSFRPELPALAVTTVLGAVALMFTLFLAAQATGLFGGEAFIRNQTGLTYAEYARRGFFQMIAASALSLPPVYAAPFAVVRDGDARPPLSLRNLMAVQLALIALVLMSALWRMGLYVRAYGLTEDRLYGTAVMLWIGAMIAVLARTVLSGRTRGAGFGSVAAAAVLLAALNLANPQGLIARYNLAHPGPRGADVSHLARLGGDAVPVLVSGLGRVGATERCALAREIVRRYGTPAGDWRGWNLARARARRAAQVVGPLASGCPAPPATEP